MSNWWLLPAVAIISIWLGAGLGIVVGALMAAAWDFFVVCATTGWQPHKVVAASAITLGIAGWIWLWDELP
jgi:hypothetical protein